jgi:SARP family transcriptional regulator, regulator of embCAB operon
MQFLLLGGMEIRATTASLSIAPKPRQVLALLALKANRVTFVEEIARELWGNQRPASYLTTLQTYIYQLRRLLDVPDSEIRIVTRPNGYMIEITEDAIDVHRFEHYVGEARMLLVDDAVAARELLDQAMCLWRGPAMADIECGEVLAGFVARLDEVRMDALEMSLEAGIRAGRHRELVGELKQLVRIHPFHEAFHAHLVLALALSGRRHEAITCFREICSVLRTELGIDPSPRLEDAFQLALRGGRVSASPSAAVPIQSRSRHPRAQVEQPRRQSG